MPLEPSHFDHQDYLSSRPSCTDRMANMEVMPALAATAEFETQDDSQMVEAEAADGEQTALCCKCGHPLTMENLAMPKSARSQQGICKACVAVTKMLQRNLGEIPEMLDAAEQQGFFKRCLELRGSDGNPLRYKQVRTELKQNMVLRTTHTHVENSGGTFQPLSWYEKQGYNTDFIESRAECRENPVLGPCYFVPLLSINESKAREKVEETLVQMERQVKRRRIQNAPASPAGGVVATTDASPSAPVVPSENDLASELVDLVSDSDEEGDTGNGAPKPTTAKQQVAMERRAKAKAQAAAKKQAEKDFKTVVALSNKAFIVLRSLLERETKCDAQITKSQVTLPNPVVERFAETCGTTKTWYAEAQSAMKKATGSSKPSLDDISFKTAKDVHQHVKDADALIKDILKVLKEQKSAAKAAS